MKITLDLDDYRSDRCSQSGVHLIESLPSPPIEILGAPPDILLLAFPPCLTNTAILSLGVVWIVTVAIDMATCGQTIVTIYSYYHCTTVRGQSLYAARYKWGLETDGAAIGTSRSGCKDIVCYTTYSVNIRIVSLPISLWLSHTKTGQNAGRCSTWLRLDYYTLLSLL